MADYAKGLLYIMDRSYLNDAGTAITKLRAAPFVSNELKNVFVSKLQLDMQTGLGMDNGASIPVASLSWSDDGGHTWGNEHFTTLGSVGAFRKRVIWRRLGRTRERVFRVTITDDCPVYIIDALIEIAATGRN